MDCSTLTKEDMLKIAEAVHDISQTYYKMAKAQANGHPEQASSLCDEYISQVLYYPKTTGLPVPVPPKDGASMAEILVSSTHSSMLTLAARMTEFMEAGQSVKG